MVFLFGSFCIGDVIFKKRFEEFDLKVFRVVNVYDVVLKVIGGIYFLWSDVY